MRFVFRAHERLHEVEVTPRGDGAYRVSVDGVTIDLEALERGSSLELRIPGPEAAPGGRDGHHVPPIRAWVSKNGRLRFLTAPGLADLVLERVEARRSARGDTGAPDLASPMPGRIVKVLVAEGDPVSKGDVLVVVEAMKTELSIVAPRDGRVHRLHGRAGDMCEAGKPLLELQAEPRPPE